MVKIKNTNESICWRGCGEWGALLQCWWNYQLIEPLFEISIVSSQKIGTQSTLRPRIPSFEDIFKESSILPQEHMFNYVHHNIIHNGTESGHKLDVQQQNNG